MKYRDCDVNMITANPKIVVAGDVTVDWFFWTRHAFSNSEKINWRLFEGVNASPQLGGAILLSKMLANSLSEISKCITDQNCKNIDLLKDSAQILHTNVKLDLFPAWESNSKSQVYRVKKYLGFTTPTGDKEYPEPLDINDDEGDHDFVIIHDAGNGFRDEGKKWPKVINGSKNPVVIYNMYPPLFEGKLWENIVEKHTENLVLILNSEDLRKLGANVSRSLSWEKTALEFLWEIKHNKKLAPIKSLQNVVVRFKAEGVIHYNGQNRNVAPKLYFDPSSVEGAFWDNKKFGMMRGISIVFVSSFASRVISNHLKIGKISDEALKESIEEGLLNAREFLRRGYGIKICENKFYEYFCEELPLNKKDEDYIECAVLPFTECYNQPDPMFWSILKEKTKDRNIKLDDVAVDIVKNGWAAIKGFPTGHFGKLTTVDRAEIEGFGSLKSIMEGYLNSGQFSRPLSVSVFGSPGSGKSFGITEVAKSIDPENVYKIDFNVSQFTSMKDLTNAFHRIRDISLKGKIPLVFFDEFDCTFEGQPLGWLRYFLAPMQDGEFMDCGSMHPIGKSIFVFAGGIYKSFQEFCEETATSPDTKKYLIENSSTSRRSTAEKCPDFVSRLRGYVNILGPNRLDENKNENDKNDDAYIIRRAVILRSLIEEKAQSIIDKKTDSSGKTKQVANIDNSLLKTLILISKYKHGVRSMEAIIDMSMLGAHNSWEKASLPPKDQLDLHVDGKEFFTILANN
ncbi:MAG: AAA family ATPase [Methanosarcina mazei]|nr:MULTISPECIES: AAA family ATPase [Methanosarcina]